MALEDISSEKCMWFGTGLGYLPETSNESNTVIELGNGKENTKNIIEMWNEWNGWNADEIYIDEENEYDIWCVIQRKNVDLDTWYVPSRAEWAAFGDFCYTKLENGMTTSNYEKNGLNAKYWTSSQYTKTEAWFTLLDYGCVRSNYVYGYLYNVRLGAIF